MPRYVAWSDAPINVREWNRPDMPDFGRPDQGLPGGEDGEPGHPWVPGSGRPRPPEGWERPRPPEGWERPELPPREDWPPLPPGLVPGPGLPIPPSIEHPWVPVHPPEGPGQLPPVWPPLPSIPDLPDMGGKTLALARIYVSRRVNYLRWVVIDHAEAKEKWEALKGRLPAGGVGGAPPQRPTPPGASTPPVDPTRR